jgi:hypothetical protein
MVEDSGADRGGVVAVAWELTGAMTAWQPLRCGRRRCGGSVSSSRAQRCSGTSAKGRRGNELCHPRWPRQEENRGSGSGLLERTPGFGRCQNEWEGCPFIAAHHVGATWACARRAREVTAQCGGRASMHSCSAET